jgi:hypothetical protein
MWGRRGNNSTKVSQMPVYLELFGSTGNGEACR